jgi:hypothetical protein
MFEVRSWLSNEDVPTSLAQVAAAPNVTLETEPERLNMPKG